jgi:cytochrome c-type biogenesis protein CcmH
VRRLVLALALLASPVWANPALERPLQDPALEARAQKLADEIRCVVCENEPVSQSSADIAVDMRHVIRDRIVAGDSDNQVRDYFADRYGDFVLLNPRVTPATWVLWGAPFVLIALGGMFLLLRSRRPADCQEEDDEAAVQALKALDQK